MSSEKKSSISSKKLKIIQEQSVEQMEWNLDNIKVNHDDRNREVMTYTHDDCLQTDKETQTEFSKAELSAKIETIVLKNELKAVVKNKSRIVSNLSFDIIAQNSVRPHEAFHGSYKQELWCTL